MIFGYARVSTQEQNLDTQLDSLKTAGAEEIIQEKITGTKVDRSELNRLLDVTKKKAIYELYQKRKNSVKDLCDMFSITKPTLYKVIGEISNNIIT